MNTTECQHTFQSLPLTELRKLHYWCTTCTEFFDYAVDVTSEMVGWSFQDMHTKIAGELGGTYEGHTTYDQVTCK